MVASFDLHLTCACVQGLAANLAPTLLRSYEEDNRIQNEQQLHDKYMENGLGPHHIGDDDQEVCMLGMVKTWYVYAVFGTMFKKHLGSCLP